MELSIDWALWFSLGGLVVAFAVFWYMKAQPAGDLSGQCSAKKALTPNTPAPPSIPTLAGRGTTRLCFIPVVFASLIDHKAVGSRFCFCAPLLL